MRYATSLSPIFLILLSGCLEQKATVIINAPIEEVWTYTGDSSKAARWSTFFDHITPLPGVPEGQIGALRRCYRHKDNSGLNWDERLEATNPPFDRHMRTFNIVRSPIPGMSGFEFDVVHQFRAIGPNQTELTFSSTLAKHDIRWSALLMLLPAGQQGAQIVKDNVENIKLLIEAHGETAKNLHPFLEKENPYFDIPGDTQGARTVSPD